MNMQAIVVQQAGGPEELRIATVHRRAPGPGEVLVRTAFTGVNFIETYQRSGSYEVPYPFTPGTEASGTVEVLGEGVTSLRVGDRVTTAQAARTYAECFTVAADLVAQIPGGVTKDEAAALTLQGLTAHFLSTSAATPQSGETVLVHAGGGGVGQLLIQLLVDRGVRVIATASSDEKRALATRAGADLAIDYADFAEQVRDATGGEGVAVAYDGVGQATFDDSLRSLRVRGDLVLFGAASGPVAPVDPQQLNAGGSLRLTRPHMRHFLRTPEERAWRYAELFDAVERGALRVNIDRVFALADAEAAHRALEGRESRGKFLLQP